MSSSSEEDEEKDVNIMDSGEEAELSRVNAHDSFLSNEMTDMSLDADTCKYRFDIIQKFVFLA